MLEQLRNGMGAGNGWRRGELRRSLCQEFGERGSVPGVFDCGSAVGIGDLLSASHGWSSLHFSKSAGGKKNAPAAGARFRKRALQVRL
jgi:hypothetical protein